MPQGQALRCLGVAACLQSGIAGETPRSAGVLPSGFCVRNAGRGLRTFVKLDGKTV